MNTKQITKPFRFFLRYLFLISLTIGASLTLGLLSFSGMLLLFPVLGIAVASFILAIAYEGEIFWQNLEAVYEALFGSYVLKRQMVREFLLEELSEFTSIGTLVGDEKDPEYQKKKAEIEEEITAKIEARNPAERDEIEDNYSFDNNRSSDQVGGGRTLDLKALEEKQKALEEKQKFRRELAILELNKVPQILIDYVQLIYQLKRLELHEHRYKLPQEDKKYKRLLMKKIKRMEIDFAKQLMSLNAQKEADNLFAKWCKERLKDKETSVRNKYYRRYAAFTMAKLFSAVAGSAIFVGTAYLLFDAFMTVAFLEFVPVAAIPIVIFTLASLAAIAYGFITYYSIMSMINNRTLQAFIKTFVKDVKQGSLLSNMVRIVLSTFVIGLAIAFTICTAGTWWSIGQNLAFLIEKAWLMGASVILFFSTLAVNLFNSICTWFEMRNGVASMSAKVGTHSHTEGSCALDAPAESSATLATQPQEHKEPTRLEKIQAFGRFVWERFSANWKSADPENDNAWLRFNMPRLLLQTLFIPIDFLLFVAHVISIGVTGDQINGLPLWLSVSLCALQEANEDAHRFEMFQYHDHNMPSVSKLLEKRSKPGSGHEHGLNLPRRLLQLALSPLILLSIVWDWVVIANTTEKNWKEALSEAATRQSRLLELAFLKPVKGLSKEDKRLKLDIETEKYDVGLIMRSLMVRLEGPFCRDPNLAKTKREEIKEGLEKVRQAKEIEEVKFYILRTTTFVGDQHRQLFWKTKGATTTGQGLEKALEAVSFTE